jgi:hypothetical protein
VFPVIVDMYMSQELPVRLLIPPPEDALLFLTVTMFSVSFPWLSMPPP